MMMDSTYCVMQKQQNSLSSAQLSELPINSAGSTRMLHMNNVALEMKQCSVKPGAASNIIE